MIFGLAINIAGNRTRFAVGIAETEEKVIADTASSLEIHREQIIVIPAEEAIRQFATIAFLAPAELDDEEE